MHQPARIHVRAWIMPADAAMPQTRSRGAGCGSAGSFAGTPVGVHAADCSRAGARNSISIFEKKEEEGASHG
jgi:hypothetical protein